MKKILAFASAGVMVLSMTACGAGGPKKDLSGSPYAGKWEAVGYEMWEIEMTSEDVGETSVTLNTDGKAEMVLMDEKADCKWDETDTGIEITGGQNIVIDGEMDGDYLVLTYSDICIYMQKAEQAFKTEKKQN